MSILKDPKPDDKRSYGHDDQNDDYSLIEASGTDANYAAFMSPETKPAWVADLYIRVVFFIESPYLLFKMW